jgi:raffinose/stachyose/melibiose transport system substrate-binding protein
MKRALPLIFTLGLVVSIVSACGSSDDTAANDKTAAPATQGKAEAAATEGKIVKIEYFQHKVEARDTYDKLIAKFEQENPGIDVVQTNVPDSGTVLRTRIAKKDVPDVITLVADTSLWGSLANDGLFADLTGDANLANINDKFTTTLKSYVNDNKIYGVPYATNALGIIYNKDEFAALGLQVPTTKDEMDKVLATIKAAHKTAFYLTLKDAGTGWASYSPFQASLQPANLAADRKAGKITYAKAYKDLTKQYLAFMNNAQNDPFSADYTKGNTEFAKGASVMYLQGIWAIPEILKANPNIKLGVFPSPVSNVASENLIVSAIDAVISISATTKHPAEAKKFVEFLMRPENAAQYNNEQKSFSTITGVEQTYEAFADLKPAFAAGRVTDFPMFHMNGLDLGIIIQELLAKKDIDAALKKMDTEYDKLATR